MTAITTRDPGALRTHPLVASRQSPFTKGPARLSILVLTCVALIGFSGCETNEPRPDPRPGPRAVSDRFADVERAARGIPGIHGPGLRPTELDESVETRELTGGVLGDPPEPTSIAGMLDLPQPNRPGHVAGHRPEPGQVVAVFELASPSRDRFVLHGTMPIPPDALTFHRGRTPLAVRSLGTTGELVPAQLEVVARDALGRPEVLEISAPVRRSGPPGSRSRYEVVRMDLDLPPPGELAEAAGELVATAGSALLSVRDVFGNRYEVDLLAPPEHPGSGGRTLVRDGYAARTLRTASVLVPTRTTGAGAPRDHLMGVHAYWTFWHDEPRVTLDLRIHNGLTNGSGAEDPRDTPLGIVYWDSVELELPSPWSAQPLLADPFFGPERQVGDRTIVPLVRGYETGELHMMPPQAQFHRRLTLAPFAASGVSPRGPMLEGQAFCLPGKGLWSWFPGSDGGHFLAQKTQLPTWEAFAFEKNKGPRAVREHIGDQLARLRDLAERGASDDNLVGGQVMGWSHPWFYADQGVAGGVDIQFVEGHRAAGGASTEALERLMLLHRMNASRHPVAQWNVKGEPADVHLWRGPDGRVPFDFRTNGRVVPPEFTWPCFGGPSADVHVRAVHQLDKRPPYDMGTVHQKGGAPTGGNASIFNWWPHDGQHAIRWTKNPKALVWLTNDALARDDLMLAASLFQLQFHGYEHVEASWSKGVTLKRFEQAVAAHPGQGIDLNREHAWGIDMMCAAYAISGDGWRAANRKWFERVTDLMGRASMPNGLISRRFHGGIVQGKYDGAQTFESLFLMHAQRCLNESVLRGTDEARARFLDWLQVRGCDYLFWPPVWERAVLDGGYVEQGPRFSYAVGLHDEPDEPPFSDEARWGARYLPEDGLSGPVERIYGFAILAYVQSLTPTRGDRASSGRFLGRAQIMWFAPASWRKLATTMFEHAARPSDDYSGNWAGFLAALQAIGAI